MGDCVTYQTRHTMFDQIIHLFTLDFYITKTIRLFTLDSRFGLRPHQLLTLAHNLIVKQNPCEIVPLDQFWPMTMQENLAANYWLIVYDSSANQIAFLLVEFYLYVNISYIMVILYFIIVLAILLKRGKWKPLETVFCV